MWTMSIETCLEYSILDFRNLFWIILCLKIRTREVEVRITQLRFILVL